MHFESLSFGALQIDGAVYERDLTIDHSEVRRWRKNSTKEYQASTAIPFARSRQT